MKGATRFIAVKVKDDGLISIHAPVKGATGSGDCGRHGGDISIHAPVKGATRQQ